MHSRNVEVDTENKDQELGAQIVIEACKAPFNSIMENAGLNSEVIWNQVVASGLNGTGGYDARSEQIVDMFKEGIIDPAKVTRTAIEKAGSVAGTIITTECLITREVTDEAGDTNVNMPMGM